MPNHQAIVRSNGLDLATQVDGEPGRPWIVLSNSIGSTLRCWDGQVADLTRSHRVLRYDARGHGGSQAPASGDTTFADLTADVLGLMDHYGIDATDLLGLSMGGMTALGLAIGHPRRVRRVICCDARADAPVPFVASWDMRIAAIQAGGMDAIVDGTLERWFTPGFGDRDPATVAAAAAMIRATAPTGYTACANALKSLDYLRDLGAIRAPTLFLCGAQDLASPPAVMRDMAARVSGSTYREIAPGAHLCNLENPEDFNAALGEWLASKEASPA